MERTLTFPTVFQVFEYCDGNMRLVLPVRSSVTGILGSLPKSQSFQVRCLRSTPMQHKSTHFIESTLVQDLQKHSQGTGKSLFRYNFQPGIAKRKVWRV
jgi:hypothetical protein